jgi:hypothetical protein
MARTDTHTPEQLQALTPEQAAELAGSGPSLSWDARKALGLALLTADDKAEIEARVRKDAYSWRKDDEVAREVRQAISDAGEGVLEFVVHGTDILWLADVMETATDIYIDTTEQIPGSEYKTWSGRKATRTRRLNRSDFAGLLAVHIREMAEHVEEQCEEEPDTVMNWSPEAKGSYTQYATQHAVWRGQHAETVAMATRVLREWTPYRLWKLERDIEDAARDDLRDSILILCRGTGRDAESAGNDLARRCQGLFSKAMDEWMKAEES